MKEAEASYREALDIYRQLTEANPATYQRKLADTLDNLATLYWTTQRMKEAEATFQESLELNPSQPYAVLWLHLSRKRLGEEDAKDLAQRAAKLDLTQWPAPVLKFYLSRMTADQLLAAAANPDSEKDKGQHCEAHFYVGEDALLQQDRVRAIAEFQTARDICP